MSLFVWEFSVNARALICDCHGKRRMLTKVGVRELKDFRRYDQGSKRHDLFENKSFLSRVIDFDTLIIWAGS